METKKFVNKKVEKLEKDFSSIQNAFYSFTLTVTSKSIGLDLEKITPLFENLQNEIDIQKAELLKEAKILPKPRSQKAILKEISEAKKVTPELLNEIQRSLAPK